MVRKLLHWILIAALLVGPAASVAAQAATIKVGVPVPLSGGSAEAGKDILRGAQLAVEQQNAKGGVLGRKVEIVEADDACDAQTAVAAARKLVNSGVVAVVGGYCSSAAIPGSAVYHEAGIPFIADASTNKMLTEQGYKEVFRVIGRDDKQGPFAAEFMIKKLKATRIAVIHDNSAYAKGLAEATRDGVQQIGGAQVVLYDAITQGEKDFTAILTKLKGLNPGATYFTGYFAEGGLLARQFFELGVAGRLLVGDANNDVTFIKLAGPSAEKVLFTTAPIGEFLPGAKAFIETFRKRFGTDPGPYSAYEYDAMNLLFDAIKRAGGTEKSKLVGSIAATRDFKGVTGTISFDGKGDRVGITYIVLTVRAGKFVLAPENR